MITEELKRDAALALWEAVATDAAKGKDAAGQPITRETLNPFKNSDEQRITVVGLLRQFQAQHEITEHDLRQLAAELVGLGLLDPLVHDPTIISINVIAHDLVMVNCGGVWRQADVRWDSEEQLRAYALSLASASGQAITDGRLVVQQHFRNPPGRIQIDATRRGDAGITIHIRLGRKTAITLSQMVSNGGCSQEMANFLCDVAQHDVGVLIIGAPGTGKTTLLEALMDYWPRVPVVGLDDHSEFSPKHPLCAVYDVTADELSDAMTHALRKNIERIAVAELRGNEAAEMLRYSNSMIVWTTLHSNVNSAVTRLMSLAQGAPHSPFVHLSDSMMRKIISTSFPVLVECDLIVVGGQSSFFISRIAHLSEDGTPSNIFLAKLEGPRLVGFERTGDPGIITDTSRRRVWGGVEMPGLDIIGKIAQKWASVALTVLAQILRIRRDLPTESLLKNIAATDEPIKRRLRKERDDYAAQIAKAIRGRDWKTVASLYDLIEADKVISVLTGGRLSADLTREEVQRRAKLVSEADELIELSQSRSLSMPMALAGLLSRVQSEPEIYAPDMEARVLESLGIKEEVI